MPLSDTAIRNAKPNTGKAYKLPDEKSMYLLINPNGAKYFRLKYRFGGKEKVLALGVYPETSLKQARDKRDEARKQLADGIAPGENRKVAKITKAHTFEHVARDWLISISHIVRDITHQKKIRRFELYVFPAIGGEPCAAVIPLAGICAGAGGNLSLYRDQFFQSMDKSAS